MLLRSKIVLIVSVVVVLYAAIDHAIQRATVTPSFVALEREEAAKDVQRVVGAIENEIYHLDMRCRDWAAWDDTADFVAEPNERYVDSNLGPQSLEDDDVNLLYICDTAGRVVWGAIQDHGTGEEITLRGFPGEALAPAHPLLVMQNEPRSSENRRGHIAGLMATEEGPILISARPILTSEREGPIQGTVIMGRFLSDALKQKLSSSTGVGFTVWELDGGEPLPADEQGILSEVTAATGPVVRAEDDELLHVYTTFPDIDQAPALLVRADVERKISAKGATSVRYALLSTIAAGLLLLLVLLSVLQKMVLNPIAKLTSHAVEIGRTEDSSVKLGLDRPDEIGILSREFDGMMEKLTLSRQQVVQAARSAGMSEIATGILHNIGNVLNSVNVSATMVSDKVKASKIAKLERLSGMVEAQGESLGEFISTDPKGQHFGPFLSEVTRLLRSEREEVMGELETLGQGIDHIRQLVSSQQSYATRTEVRELTRIEDRIEEALHLSGQVLGRSGATVEHEIEEDLPKVRVDGHKLLEILVNLITNAHQALASKETGERRITLRARTSGEDSLRIEVSDNGVGIPAENLAKVFHHGFTTRKDGHGFGLHSAANAATEMGGSLTAHSDGEGTGATFVLELPLAPGTKVAAAIPKVEPTQATA